MKDPPALPQPRATGTAHIHEESLMDEEDLDIMIQEDEAAKEEAEATAVAEHVKRLSKAKEPKTTHMCIGYINNTHACCVYTQHTCVLSLAVGCGCGLCLIPCWRGGRLISSLILSWEGSRPPVIQVEAGQ